MKLTAEFVVKFEELKAKRVKMIIGQIMISDKCYRWFKVSSLNEH